MRKAAAILLASIAFSLSPAAQTPTTNRVLTHREQAPLKFHWVEQRFKTILPALMRREGIDMWVIVSREYNDDPVFASMAPVTTYSSRRRTILVFFDRGSDKGVEHLSIGRFDYDGLFALEKTENDGQWDGLAEAFSNRVVVPGVTTNEDVAWWMRQRVAEMGHGQWFHPTITVWRKGGLPTPAPAGGYVIQRGDMVHCDFGIVYLGFSTDTQHNAYVLRSGEAEAPQGLKDGLKAANRLQDLTLQSAKLGASGNQALAGALTAAKTEGLTPSIYCPGAATTSFVRTRGIRSS